MVADPMPVFAEKQLSNENVLRLQYDLSIKGLFRDTETIRTTLRETSIRFGKDPASLHLPHFPDSVLKLASLLLGRTWTLLEPVKGGSFVSSDAPVCSFKLDEGGQVFGGYGFGREDTVVYLPVSENKAWIASPSQFAWHEQLDEQSTATMNRLAISFAEEMVFSRERIPDLQPEIERVLGTTHFGINAFVNTSATASFAQEHGFSRASTSPTTTPALAAEVRSPPHPLQSHHGDPCPHLPPRHLLPHQPNPQLPPPLPTPQQTASSSSPPSSTTARKATTSSTPSSSCPTTSTCSSPPPKPSNAP